MIRKGTDADIDRVAEIYDAILTAEEEGKTAIGWKRGIYPTRKTAEAAVYAGDLFVMEHNSRVIAAARINQIQVPEYKDALWQYQNTADDKIMVLHTLVVDPEVSGKGFGTEFVKFYEEYALSHDCPYLRMDTNAKNTAARRLYARLGYCEVGIVPCVFNGIKGVSLVCLEKYLER